MNVTRRAHRNVAPNQTFSSALPDKRKHACGCQRRGTFTPSPLDPSVKGPGTIHAVVHALLHSYMYVSFWFGFPPGGFNEVTELVVNE